MGRREAGVGLIYGDAALLQSALVLLVNPTQGVALGWYAKPCRGSGWARVGARAAK